MDVTKGRASWQSWAVGWRRAASTAPLRRVRTLAARGAPGPRWVGGIIGVVGLLAACAQEGSSVAAIDSSSPAAGTAASHAPEAGPAGPGPFGSSTTTMLGTDGPRIYQVKCAGCHGLRGEGDLGPSLIGVADRLTSEEQFRVVADGRATMLAFSPPLTDDQIAAVVAYTRSAW